MSKDNLDDCIGIVRELLLNHEAMLGIDKDDITIYTYFDGHPRRISDLLTDDQYERIIKLIYKSLKRNRKILEAEVERRGIPKEMIYNDI